MFKVSLVSTEGISIEILIPIAQGWWFANLSLCGINKVSENVIDFGFIIKHEWFNSKNIIKEKFNFNFPRKEEILSVMEKIEGLRNSLCYGKRKDEKELLEFVSNFNELKRIFSEVSGYEL